MNSHLVAVYGTLKKGHGNHRLLEHSELVAEEAITSAPAFRLYGYKRAYPFVQRMNDGGQQISCQVYRVDDNTLKSLDYLEGHPNFYKREMVSFDDNSYEAELYLFQGDLPEDIRKDTLDTPVAKWY